MRIETGHIIHFQSRLYGVVTMSRTITKKVKLAPVVRSAGTPGFCQDGEPEWHDLEKVERHASLVDANAEFAQP